MPTRIQILFFCITRCSVSYSTSWFWGGFSSLGVYILIQQYPVKEILFSCVSIYMGKENYRRCPCQQISSVIHCFRFFETTWTAAHQAFLPISNSRSLLKLMSIESVMRSNHLILCHPLLLSPSIFPSIRVFSNESVLCIRWPKFWSFSFHQSFQWIFSIDFL